MSTSHQTLDTINLALNSTILPQNTTHPTEFPLNCHDPKTYDKFAGCYFREDITVPLQLVFLACFGLCLILALFACKNLLLSIPKRGHKAFHFKTINLLLFIYLLARVAYFSDAILLASYGWKIPLYVVIILDYASAFLLNTVMVIGAYCWINTILTSSFNNNKKKINASVCLGLCIMNLIFLGGVIAMSLMKRLKDEDHMPSVKIWSLPNILVFISTSTNELYFVFSCILLINRLARDKRTCSKSAKEGVSLIIAIISFVRAGRNFVAAVHKDVRKDSIVNDDYLWSAILFTYLIITEVIPAILLLTKFSPSEDLGLQKSVSGVTGVKTTVFNESLIEREAEKFASSMPVRKSTAPSSAKFSFNTKDTSSYLDAREALLGQ